MPQWFLIIMLLVTAADAASGQERCETAVAAVEEARKQARPGVSRSRLEQLKAQLDRATDFCSTLGDAWYYRALYARELGDQRDAARALEKAERFNSAAWQRRDDPFASAAPPAPATPAATNATAPAAPDAKLPPLGPVREKYALVVGISKFLDQNIPQLTYTAKDARDFAGLLTDSRYGRFKPGNVKLLTDEDATEKKIKTAIGELMDKAQPDDLVVCYISSHGSERKNGGGQAGVSYIVTYDTTLKDLYATSLKMVEVVDDFSKLIKAQRVAIFLDTCYSGEAVGAKALRSTGAKALTPVGVSQELLSRVDQTVGRIIISASQANEQSWESPELKNSVFTYYLMEALKQDKGQATLEQAFSYLKEKVVQRVRSERQAVQTPVMRGNTRQGQIDIRIGVTPQVR